MTTDAEYAAMAAALRRQAVHRRARRVRVPPTFLLAAALFAAGLLIASHNATTPAAHRNHAACTVARPCHVRTGPAARAVAAYVVLRTARGLLRVPLHAARMMLYARAMRAGGSWGLPLPSGDGG